MLQSKRPDTPLANTPEATFATSGLQPMSQPIVQPISKFQAAADSAIQGINNLSKERMMQNQQQ